MKIKLIFENIKDKLRFLYKNNKKFLVAVLIILALIVFSIIFMVFPVSTSKSKDKVDDKNNSSQSTYGSILESKIKMMLKSVNEVNSVEVLIMFDGTEENNYLIEKSVTDTTGQNSSSKVETESVVFEKNGSTSSPILQSTKYPKVVGVLIVTNKISPSTKLSIINALSIVLNIDASCISILQEA